MGGIMGGNVPRIDYPLYLDEGSWRTPREIVQRAFERRRAEIEGRDRRRPKTEFPICVRIASAAKVVWNVVEGVDGWPPPFAKSFNWPMDADSGVITVSDQDVQSNKAAWVDELKLSVEQLAYDFMLKEGDGFTNLYWRDKPWWLTERDHYRATTRYLLRMRGYFF